MIQGRSANSHLSLTDYRTPERRFGLLYDSAALGCYRSDRSFDPQQQLWFATCPNNFAQNPPGMHSFGPRRLSPDRQPNASLPAPSRCILARPLIVVVFFFLWMISLTGPNLSCSQAPVKTWLNIKSIFLVLFFFFFLPAHFMRALKYKPTFILRFSYMHGWAPRPLTSSIYSDITIPIIIQSPGWLVMVIIICF